MLTTEKLIEISSVFQKDLNEDQVYEAVFQVLKGVVQFDAATLFLYNKKNKKLEKYLNHGEYVVELAEDTSFLPQMGLSNWISRQKKPVIIPVLTKSRSALESRHFNSFLALPLRIEKMLIGVLNLGHKKPHIYNKKDLDTYQFLAFQISMLVDKLNLKKQLNLHRSRLLEMTTSLKKTQNQLDKGEENSLATVAETALKANQNIQAPLKTILSRTKLLAFTIETRNQRKLKHLAKQIVDAALQIKEHYQKMNELNEVKE